MNIIQRVLGGITGLVTGAILGALAFPRFMVLTAHSLRLKGLEWKIILPILTVSSPLIVPIFVLVSLVELVIRPFNGAYVGFTKGLKAAIKYPYNVYLEGLAVVDEGFGQHQEREEGYHQEGHNPDEIYQPDVAPIKSSNDALLARIESLPADANVVAWLSQNEIDDFKKVISEMKDPNEQKQNQDKLKKYLVYSESACSISGTVVKELSQPITIRGTYAEEGKNPRKWVKTFELATLKNFINSSTTTHKFAFEPETRDPLNDPDHIKINRGIDKHICGFIRHVRSTVQTANSKIKPQQRVPAQKLISAIDSKELRARRLRHFDKLPLTLVTNTPKSNRVGVRPSASLLVR